MISAILYTDFYKTDHRRQYPEGTTKVYSNFTARISRIPEIENVLVFGIQYFVRQYLIREFNETFFLRNKETVLWLYKRRMDTSLGKGAVTLEHLDELHALGYLPIHLKALPEGTLCPLRVPILTVTNTHPDFGWLPNFLETLLSNALWHPITSATIAFEYRKILEAYANRTSDIKELVKWQGHDFSMRGQTSLTSSMVSGGAHLTCFTGTDTIPAIDFLEKFYDADADKELIGGSVPATEHSVMCLGGRETELETYRRLVTKVYPAGFVSIVSDTWDYWKILTETLPALKTEILAREGKVVIRPDSGDPVKIICGDPTSIENYPAYLGTMRLLWDTFGGTINSKGYKQLNAKIGVIYGDSITLDRCLDICARLEDAGFSSTNMVFGIGSYTYQYVTRDTFGFAMKATYGEVNGEAREIFKDPLTDGGVKKSAKGLLRIDACEVNGLRLSECVSKDDENGGLLRTVFKDGKEFNSVTLADVRKRVDEEFT